MTKLEKIANKVDSIETAQDLKKAHLTLAEYEAVREVLSELYDNGKSDTFMSGVAEFFRKNGAKVTEKTIDYVITV